MHRLSSFQSERLERSLASLEKLDVHLEKQSSAAHHAIGYVVPFGTLVHNPDAVAHMCAQLTAHTNGGIVDVVDVPGLMQDVDGKECGKMVVVTAAVPGA